MLHDVSNGFERVCEELVEPLRAAIIACLLDPPLHGCLMQRGNLGGDIPEVIVLEIGFSQVQELIVEVLLLGQISRCLNFDEEFIPCLVNHKARQDLNDW